MDVDDIARLATGLIRGYTGRSPLAGSMSHARVRAWIVVGGLQFIHGRHVEPLDPERTPEVAARVLTAFL